MTTNGITVEYLNSNVPSDVVAATQAAAAAWGAALSPDAPITIEFSWRSLSSGVLGAAGPTNYYGYETSEGLLFVPVAILNHQEQRDIVAGESEMQIELASNLYGRFGGWCTSIDGSDCDQSRISLYDTVLHEMAHGLGMLGSGNGNGRGGLSLQVTEPDLFDTHVYVGQGSSAQALLGTSNPLPQLVGQNLYLRSATNQYYRLHAPPNFEPGSSYSHLDEETFGSQLLTPTAASGEFEGRLDATTMDVMQTVGWGTGIIDGRTIPTVTADQCAANNPTLGSAGGPYAAQVAADPHLASIWRLYSAVYLRQPDSGGFAFWNGRLNPAAGGSVENYRSAADFFTASDEFDETYGALSNAAFVDRLYCNIFTRLPDAGGRSYWIGQLSSGAQSRGDVILFWADSQEFRDRTNVPLLRY